MTLLHLQKDYFPLKITNKLISEFTILQHLPISGSKIRSPLTQRAGLMAVSQYMVDWHTWHQSTASRITNYLELLWKYAQLLSTVTASAMCCPVHSSCLWGKCPAMPGWGCRKHNSTLTQLLPMFCQMPAIIYLPSKGWTEAACDFSSTVCALFLKLVTGEKVERKQSRGHYFACKHLI